VNKTYMFPRFISESLALLLFVSPCYAQQKKVAILNFENAIFPKKIASGELGLYNIDRQYNYLERAFTDMLISDLADIEGIELVERSRVEKLLDEIHLGKTGAVAEKTVQKIGQALQADYLIFGYITKKESKIVLRTKIQNVSNKQIIEINRISDFEKNIFELEKKIYLHICSNIQISTISIVARGSILIGTSAPSIVVLPFNNNSKADKLNYLQSALSDMLTVELVNHKIFKLVEREQIDKIFKELALQRTGIIDETTAIQIGELLGAKYILLGSFIQVGDIIRIDARMSAVETGRTPIMVHSAGNRKSVLRVVEKLIDKIVIQSKK